MSNHTILVYCREKWEQPVLTCSVPRETGDLLTYDQAQSLYDQLLQAGLVLDPTHEFSLLYISYGAVLSSQRWLVEYTQLTGPSTNDLSHLPIFAF